jgi:hypothetical protein
MAGKKVIAVIGGTGAQGGSLVRAILKDDMNGSFVARALTRDPSKVREKEISITVAASYRLSLLKCSRILDANDLIISLSLSLVGIGDKAQGSWGRGGCVRHGLARDLWACI